MDKFAHEIEKKSHDAIMNSLLAEAYMDRAVKSKSKLVGRTNVMLSKAMERRANQNLHQISEIERCMETNYLLKANHGYARNAANRYSGIWGMVKYKIGKLISRSKANSQTKASKRTLKMAHLQNEIKEIDSFTNERLLEEYGAVSEDDEDPLDTLVKEKLNRIPTVI